MTDVVEDPVLEEGSCSNSECSYSEDGVCVAKGDANECEFFEPVTLDEDHTEEPVVATVAVPAGEALLPEHIDRVLAETPARTVVPLGLVKAGKTTLMCLIFDQVRTRRLLPWAFMRSKTIVGFARRSHYSSVRSGMGEGTTPRTSLEESGMSLHLACRDEDGEPHDLLLVDLSGEHVRQLADGTIADPVAASLKRADHVPIVVNGRHIADPDRRAGAIYAARSLLGMVEQQDMPAHVSVSVVITKGDLLGEVNLDEIFDEITRMTIASDAPRFVTADRESKAVKGADPAVERGFGVADLLAHLTTGPVRATGHWPITLAPPPARLLARMWRAT